jgi:DNA-directed RNA polymerase specialized sigma24 family protein
MIEELSRSQLEELIDEWIVGKNGERNRAILKRRLIDGLTYEQIAEEFELSVRQTKTIIYKEEQRLIKHI